MSSRRLESTGVDARASVALEAHDIEKAARGSIHRRRLTGIGKPGSRAAESGSADQTADASMFLLDTGQARAGKSLDEVLAEFVMPTIADPAILKRSASILQTFVEEMVPQLDGGDQLKTLARTLVGEEIEKRRELLARMQENPI